MKAQKQRPRRHHLRPCATRTHLTGRTIPPGTVIDYEKGMKSERNQYVLNGMVPRRGLEPPRLAAQVPETCASTNSAIWATERHVRGRPAAVNRHFEVFATAWRIGQRAAAHSRMRRSPAFRSAAAEASFSAST